MSDYSNYLFKQILIILLPFFPVILAKLGFSDFKKSFKKEYYILTYLCTVIAFIVFAYFVCVYQLGLYIWLNLKYKKLIKSEVT